MDASRIAGCSRKVDLEALKTDPGPYCMSFGFDLEPLVRSLREVGVINEPLVEEDGVGRLDVITGYRRILALRTLGFREIPVRVLEDQAIPPLGRLLINLHENLSTRKLNDVEKGMVLSRLSRHLPEKDVIEKYLPLLGLPSRREELSVYTRVEAEFGGELKEGLARGVISFQAAKRMMKIEPESWSAVFRVIRESGLNSNQQKDFMEILSDLSRIDGRKGCDILEESELERILCSPLLNRPQKGKRVLRWLRERRFPRLVKAERDFRASVARMALPGGVKIEAPPFFEGPFFRLEILFKEGRELAEKMEALLCSEGLPGLGNPWEKGQ